MNKLLEQNDISEMRSQGADLSGRWREILERIVGDTGFVPDWKRIRKSEWWRTGKIGAVSCYGFVDISGDKKPAVLKIQGTKPQVSEVKLIELFRKNNRSIVVRPPLVYASIPWNSKDQYEALVVESVEGKPPISGRPGTDSELDMFFTLYGEYRRNCRSNPWLDKPKGYSFKNRLDTWMGAVEQRTKEDRFGVKDDIKLTRDGISILESNISVSDLEFVHGHFYVKDLVVVNRNEIVLFSNLLWGWRIPFYDAVFAYHWWMLGMGSIDDFSETRLEEERGRWLERIYSLDEVKLRKGGEKLVSLALLERAIPALMVDRLMIEPTNPSARIIVKGARKELDRLVSKLS